MRPGILITRPFALVLLTLATGCAASGHSDPLDRPEASSARYDGTFAAGELRDDRRFHEETLRIVEDGPADNAVRGSVGISTVVDW